MILLASEYYPPFAPGGAEWSNAAWAAALARHGHRVTVVTPNYGASSREEHEGVTVIRVPFPIRLRPGQYEAGWFVHRNPAFHFYFSWQLWRVARAEGAQVIHALGKGVLVAAWLAGRALRRPVVATVRDMGLLCPLGLCPLFEPRAVFDCSTTQYLTRCVPFYLRNYLACASPLGRLRARVALGASWLDHGFRRTALRGAAGIVGVSRGILAIYPETLVRGRGHVVYTLPPRVAMPSPAEVERARRRHGIGGGPLVLCAGKRSLGKGTAVLVDALEPIRAAVRGVRFAFAGKGDVQVPPGPDVHVLGVVEQPELFALYCAADVIVVPSIWPEPLSRVLLEAMRLGRPVVATAVGGTPEAVEHGVTGLIVPARDAVALAGAVIELLHDAPRRQRMGRAAAERVSAVFDEERIVKTLLDTYAAAGAA